MSQEESSAVREAEAAAPDRGCPCLRRRHRLGRPGPGHAVSTARPDLAPEHAGRGTCCPRPPPAAHVSPVTAPRAPRVGRDPPGNPPSAPGARQEWIENHAASFQLDVSVAHACVCVRCTCLFRGPRPRATEPDSPLLPGRPRPCPPAAEPSEGPGRLLRWLRRRAACPVCGLREAALFWKRGLSVSV